jgi:hypothetical protein
VTFETSIEGDGTNATLFLVIRDQNRNPVPTAQLSIGSPFSYQTYITDQNGSLIADLGALEPGQRVDIEFPGDTSRYLIPASVNVTVPESNTTAAEGMKTWIYGIISIIAVIGLIIGAMVVIRRRRIDTGSKRVEEARTSTLYPFEPKKGAQEMIFNSYSSILRDLTEKGIEKPPEMTPDEFDEAVRGSTWNSDLSKMEEITRLFDEARYSDHDLSSHLISKAKSIENELNKEIITLEQEGLKEKFEKAREELSTPVTRHIIWKMKLDHEADLKDLIGKKGDGE